MTGLKKSSLFEFYGEMEMDQFRRYAIEFKEAMRDVGTAPIKLVLPACASESGGCNPDERDRRTVYEVTILRKSENGLFSEAFWVCREPEAGSKAHAGDGDSGDISWPKHQFAPYGTCYLSVSASRSADRAPQPCLECGYNLHSVVERFCVSGGDRRLVFPICIVLPTFQQFGDDLLSRGSGRGVGEGCSGYFQYGSGMSIYQRRFYGRFKKARDQNQHGWSGSCFGQYFCGEALEKCEIREHLSQGVSDNDRGARGLKKLLSVLQRREVSSIAGVSDTQGGLRGKSGMGRSLYRSTLIHKKEIKKESEKQVIKTKKTV